MSQTSSILCKGLQADRSSYAWRSADAKRLLIAQEETTAGSRLQCNSARTWGRRPSSKLGADAPTGRAGNEPGTVQLRDALARCARTPAQTPRHRYQASDDRTNKRRHRCAVFWAPVRMAHTASQLDGSVLRTQRARVSRLIPGRSSLAVVVPFHWLHFS